MPKRDREWHKQDMADELGEYNEEAKLIKKWSELSDVVYTCTRSAWSGHVLEFPLQRWQFALGVVYMIPKYTGRWLFFRAAGKKAGVGTVVHEVRNPQKTHKLHHIAEKYGIDRQEFQTICEKQLRYWPLLP